jgi:predicted nucleotidyltransferase
MRRESSGSVKVSYPNVDLKLILEELRRVAYLYSDKLRLMKMVVFGSYVKNRQTAASDIDVFIVYKGSKRVENNMYKTLRRSVNLPRVELHLLAEKDYKAMKHSRWIREIEEEGVKIL